MESNAETKIEEIKTCMDEIRDAILLIKHTSNNLFEVEYKRLICQYSNKRKFEVL